MTRARTLTWRWSFRRLLGLPAICPACMHPTTRVGHKCNIWDDPPPSNQWRFRHD